MQRMRVLGASALLILALLIPGQPASAHAVLVQALPGVSKILYKAPTSVTLTFDDDLINLSGSNQIQVFDSKKRRVDLGVTQLSGATITAKVKILSLGTYRVVYRVLSADGHPVSSSYYFYLKKK